MEADFPRYEAIRIECGQRFYFTDTAMHGSERRSNVVIFEPVNTVSFNGGFSSGAHLAGMEIFGWQVSVNGMDFLANSGVRECEWAGIVLQAPSWRHPSSSHNLLLPQVPFCERNART